MIFLKKKFVKTENTIEKNTVKINVSDKTNNDDNFLV